MTNWGPYTNECFSGAARGADETFGRLALKAKHAVLHYSFVGHHAVENCGPLYPIADDLLAMADPYVASAASALKRPFPTRNTYVNNLLRRNFYQIADADRVYAVAPTDPMEPVDEPTPLFSDPIAHSGRVVGGTAWALMMAYQLGVPEIYLFDQQFNLWFRAATPLRGQVPHIVWLRVNTVNGIDQVTKPHGRYAGIGTRNLTPEGRKAIEDLYA
jgi:hypothetical protein